MKTELERAERALGVAVDTLKSISQGSCPTWLRTECYGALESVGAILNPPPEMESVEVVRWTFGDGCDTFATEDEACDNATRSGEVYKLTGFRHRPKPQPVERSVSGPVEWVREGINAIPLSSGAPYFDFDAVVGKTGTLTFAWMEPSK